MFDVMGMMSKLKEAQQKIEETKKRLNSVLIDETGANGQIKVTVTANRNVKSIEISDALLTDKEALEDYIIITLNKALERANQIHEQELASVAKAGMPSIPGMDFFK